MAYHTIDELAEVAFMGVSYVQEVILREIRREIEKLYPANPNGCPNLHFTAKSVWILTESQLILPIMCQHGRLNVCITEVLVGDIGVSISNSNISYSNPDFFKLVIQNLQQRIQDHLNDWEAHM